MVAIDTAASCVGKAFDVRLAGGHQHIEKARDVGGVCCEGIRDAPRDAPERCLMKNVDHVFARIVTLLEVADVALDQAKFRPLIWAHDSSDFIEIALMSCGKVVQPHHKLVQM